MAGEVIFAKLSQLEAFGTKVVTDFAALTARVQSLERAGGQPNIIEKILVNGIQLAVDGNKAVNFSVPTKTGELENDAGFQNGEDVDAKLEGKADNGHTHDDRYYTEAEIDQKLQGLPTAGHKHTKSDITDFPALGTAAAKNVGDFAAASHTHNYAGSSRAGGAANSANKLNTNAGSSTQGVYFKDGVPVVMTYTLGKSVPADAKFTDTDTWRGVQDNLTSTATNQSLSANQGKVLKGLLDGKAASSHTHDDRYYTESEMNTKLNGKANASHTHDDRYYTESEMNAKLNGKANSSHTHNYAGSGSAGGTANSVNGLTFAAQTTDPGAGSALTTNKVLIVYA